VKTNDYGTYDPTPTMAKPHFKDIPNWLTVHLYIWDRRLIILLPHMLQLSRSWLTAGLMIPTHIWEIWYALHIILYSINLVSCIDEQHTRGTYICMYVHLYFVDIYISCAFLSGTHGSWTNSYISAPILDIICAV
jgi:hypothetical protein